jgi:hypothetical protein
MKNQDKIPASLLAAFALIQPRVISINEPRPADWNAIEGTISGELPGKVECDTLNEVLRVDRIRVYFKPSDVAGGAVKFRLAKQVCC